MERKYRGRHVSVAVIKDGESDDRSVDINSYVSDVLVYIFIGFILCLLLLICFIIIVLVMRQVFLKIHPDLTRNYIHSLNQNGQLIHYLDLCNV